MPLNPSKSKKVNVMTHQERPVHPSVPGIPSCRLQGREVEDDKLHCNYVNGNSYQNCTDVYIERPIMKLFMFQKKAK